MNHITDKQEAIEYIKSWVEGFDSAIQQIITPKQEENTMKFKDYEVILRFSGSHTFFVSAPDDDEAYQVAMDELENMGIELEIDITDSEICEVDGSYDG
jgi:hypothetical protein